MKRVLILILLCVGTMGYALAQGEVGVKTNLLYGASAFAPNLGVQIGLGERTMLDISGGYNWFNRSGDRNGNKKRVHWLVQPEYRYFLCEKYNGHFFGVHALFGQYNIGGLNLPMLFGKGSKELRHDGWAAGAGVSYGYQLMLGKNWNVEFNVGVGYARLKYDTYNCAKCGSRMEEGKTRNYFGPTKAGVSLIWIINTKK